MDFFSNRRFLWNNQTNKCQSCNYKSIQYCQNTSATKLKMKLFPLRINHLYPKLSLLCFISDAPKLDLQISRFDLSQPFKKWDLSIHEMHSALAEHGWESVGCRSDLWFFLCTTLGSPEYQQSAEKRKETHPRAASHATCEFHSNASGFEISVTITTQMVLVLPGMCVPARGP